MLKTFKFYNLYIIVMTMSLALLAGSELYKEVAKETILDDHVSVNHVCVCLKFQMLSILCVHGTHRPTEKYSEISNVV